MATTHKGRSATEQRSRSSAAVPVREMERTLCPHCCKVQSISRLTAYGCYFCGNMPNAARRSS